MLPVAHILPMPACWQVDLTFSSCPPLQPLPRLVYALLRSPLLSSAAQYHSDLTSYLHHLWCCLPPNELAKAVYPGLKAFADPDTLLAEGLPLSRESLQGPQLAEAAAAAAREVVAAASAASQVAAAEAGMATAAAPPAAGVPDAVGPPSTAAVAAAAEYAQQAQAALALAQAVAEGQQAANILLLDAFILVLVVYRTGAPADLPFPPPQHSKLWRMIQDIKRVSAWLMQGWARWVYGWGGVHAGGGFGHPSPPDTTAPLETGQHLLGQEGLQLGHT